MRTFTIIFITLISVSISSGLSTIFSAQTLPSDCLPTATQNRFVYDLADLLSDSEEASLQGELLRFKDTTSNVIVVITHPDFCGYESSVFAIEAGDQLGVGRSDLDNGIVLVIKPRNETGSGKIFISIGEGLEGAIPDILTGRIVERMIPELKAGNWKAGISVGISDLSELASGEISESEYLEKKGGAKKPQPMQILFFILMFGAIPFLSLGANSVSLMRRNKIAFGAALAIVLVESRSRQNAYNNFSHGTGRYGSGRSGGFGGSSGGFGGFGGGGFGGGGAGGSF